MRAASKCVISWAALSLLLCVPLRGGAQGTPTSQGAAKKAPATQPHTHDDDDDVEEVDVTPATVTPAAGKGKAAKEPSLIGKLHPLTVHIPIGWLLLLVLLELAALRWQWLTDVGLPLALLTVASFVPAMITGLLRAQDTAAVVAEKVLQHRNMMLLAAGALLVATITRWARRKEFAGGPRIVYLLLLLLAAALMSLGGHLGGKLVFGDAYLPF